MRQGEVLFPPRSIGLMHRVLLWAKVWELWKPQLEYHWGYRLSCFLSFMIACCSSPINGGSPMSSAIRYPGPVGIAERVCQLSLCSHGWRVVQDVLSDAVVSICPIDGPSFKNALHVMVISLLLNFLSSLFPPHLLSFLDLGDSLEQMECCFLELQC